MNTAMKLTITVSVLAAFCAAIPAPYITTIAVNAVESVLPAMTDAPVSPIPPIQASDYTSFWFYHESYGATWVTRPTTTFVTITQENGQTAVATVVDRPEEKEELHINPDGSWNLGKDRCNVMTGNCGPIKRDEPVEHLSLWDRFKRFWTESWLDKHNRHVREGKNDGPLWPENVKRHVEKRWSLWDRLVRSFTETEGERNERHNREEELEEYWRADWRERQWEKRDEDTSAHHWDPFKMLDDDNTHSLGYKLKKLMPWHWFDRR